MIIPKGFLDTFMGEDGTIEFEFSTPESKTIILPSNPDPAYQEHLQVAHERSVKKHVESRPDFYEVCNKHRGYKGRCGCK